MAYQRNFRREESQDKTINCSCGGTSKLTSRKNYTHGRKSSSITSWFYKCLKCKKISHSSKKKVKRR